MSATMSTFDWYSDHSGAVGVVQDGRFVWSVTLTSEIVVRPVVGRNGGSGLRGRAANVSRWRAERLFRERVAADCPPDFIQQCAAFYKAEV